MKKGIETTLRQVRNIAANTTSNKSTVVPPILHKPAKVVEKKADVQSRIVLPEKMTGFDIRQHIPAGPVVKNNSVTAHRALGMHVWDKDNRKYLDMTAGIGVLGTGHRHPYVVDAIKRQLDHIVLSQQAMFFSHTIQDEFVEKFLKYTPGGKGGGVAKHDTFVFTSSGSEATENAVKVAKMHTGRPNVIAMNKGFHGRTFAAMAWSASKTSYKSGFVNPTGGVYFCHEPTPEALDLILTHQSAPHETACVILEPVQGEGGVNQIPKATLEYIRKKCDEHNIVLIYDEVQSGAGRCGKFWAHELVGVEPDICAYAKAIGSGMPLGGICGPKQFFERLTPNALGSTYGGNALCLASANATLDVIEDENLLDNINKMGKIIADEVRNMPHITGIRQHGLLIAADVDPEVAPIGRVIKKGVDEQALILHSCGTNSLRIIPSYIIGEQDVEVFHDRLYNILKNLEKEDAFKAEGSKVM